MRKSCLFVLIVISPLIWTGFHSSMLGQSRGAPAPAPSTSFDPRQVELANLRADVQSLDRRLREMTINLEELMRQNQELQAQLERQQRTQSGQLGDVVRQGQLTSAINDLHQRTQAADTELRRQIIRDVTQQIEQLGRQTQAAIDALAARVNAAPQVRTTPTAARPHTFSDDFPREGITYTVQRGDTLSAIASRNNSTVRDIQNANQISDPGSIQPGQTLFIPQRR